MSLMKASWRMRHRLNRIDTSSDMAAAWARAPRADLALAKAPQLHASHSTAHSEPASKPRNYLTVALRGTAAILCGLEVGCTLAIALLVDVGAVVLRPGFWRIDGVTSTHTPIESHS